MAEQDYPCKISVVLPVYNVKNYLERCVKSVQGQSYKNLEIILVDDGSTDGGGLLCDDYAAQDERVKVIHQVNQGLSEARNTGIRHATGDYIVFVDSDDEWLLADGLETLMRESRGQADLVVFKAVDIWPNAQRLPMADYDVEHISQLPDAQAVFAYLIRSQRFRAGVWQLLIRTSVLKDNSIFFPKGLISEDVYWDMHLWQHLQTVTVVNLDFYGYYHRAASLSTTPSIRVDRSYDKIFSDWKQQCLQDCVNAPAIRVYLANLWVSRGYNYHRLKAEDKPEALAILKRHADLLDHAATAKSRLTARLVGLIGVAATTTVLGAYWRFRSWYNNHAV